MSLDFPAFGIGLWELYDVCGVRPEYLLAPMFIESAGYQVGIQNLSGADQWGLIQMSGKWLRGRGIDPASLKGWLASEELARIVKPFITSQVRALLPLKSGIRVYQSIFLPASLMKSRPEYAPGLLDVITRSPELAYKGNAGFDPDKKGTITPGDLGRTLREHAVKAAPVQDAIAETYALRPAEYVRDPVYGEDFVTPARPTTQSMALSDWASIVAIAGGLLTGYLALQKAS